jgi:hypothetical protein
MKTIYILRTRNLIKKMAKIVPWNIEGLFTLLDNYCDYCYFKDKIIKYRFKQLNWKDSFFLKESDPEKHFDPHYIYHTGWAARKIISSNVEFHNDFSSSLYFSSIISAVTPVVFYDFRPAKLNLSNYEGKSADLVNLNIPSKSLNSISCMHVIEHIGLGRYGDSMDPDADIKACNELQRVASCGGKILIVVPVGKPKICFNAHRIYSHDMVSEMFSNCELVSNALIPDNANKVGIIYEPEKKMFDEQNYACGCFEFIKK